jgi:WhiB family redox-sensing transcriptional regulator
VTSRSQRSSGASAFDEGPAFEGPAFEGPAFEGVVTVEETPIEFVWMMHARCRGASPTEFFPSDGMGVEAAQRVCAKCSVRVDCLEYALEHRIEHGVWGGASERERRRILRRRRGLTPAPPA